MIDSLTVVSKGGLILYESHPSSSSESAGKINAFIVRILLDPTKSAQNRYIREGTVAEWKDSANDDFYVVTLYPEVVLKSTKSVVWLSDFMDQLVKEYAILYNNSNQQLIPNDALFDKTYAILWNQALKQKDAAGSRSWHSDEAKSNQDAQQRKLKLLQGAKEKRLWGEAKVTKQAMQDLDFSTADARGGEVDNDQRALKEARAAYLPTSEEMPAWEDDERLIDDAATEDGNGWGSSLKGFLDQVVGNKVLTEKDLEAPLQEIQKQLTSKNVANDIALEICNTVRSKLAGKRMQSFARVKTAVRQALEVAVTKLLAPDKARKVDPLRGVITKRDGGFFGGGSSNKRPFSIAFIGINGVGKSTSLAKVCYYLKTNGCSPMLAACDTFRSGAVEQLNVHAKCLEVPLFQKGYSKDPSSVAKAAVDQAAHQGNDVVLIDTAGRMQNNVPLMKALSKLVVENNPDLVLFVCEALVGNDGMDQLSMFNKALRNGGHSRQIDGIILTKFDTVSDKVGAALTMTHVTGAPVVFVGTGQKYTHLKKLSPQAVIKSLFS